MKTVWYLYYGEVGVLKKEFGFGDNSPIYPVFSCMPAGLQYERAEIAWG